MGKKSACQLRQDRLSNPPNDIFSTLFGSFISWSHEKTVSGPYSRSWSKTTIVEIVLPRRTPYTDFFSAGYKRPRNIKLEVTVDLTKI